MMVLVCTLFSFYLSITEAKGKIVGTWNKQSLELKFHLCYMQQFWNDFFQEDYAQHIKQ